IDQCRGERVGFADSQVKRAIREIPPAKSGVVAKACEITGEIRMSAAVAHAPKQLIALAEVCVSANVEVVVVIGLAAVGKIVVTETRSICYRKELQQLEGVGVNASGGQLIHQIHLGGSREIGHSSDAAACIKRIA